MTSVYTNLYYNQPIIVLDTTVATPTSGSLVLYGGLSAKGNNILSGLTSIINSTQSNSPSSGSIVISGGVGIQKNLNVGGNSIINGNANIIGAFSSASVSTPTITSIDGHFTNFTTSNFQADYIHSVTISTGTIISSFGNFSTVATSILSATTITGGDLFLSGDLTVAGTINSVNVTSINIIETNITAGVAYITDTLSASGSSNTLGSIFTTSGNVGINQTDPQYQLDVNGTSNFTDVMIANAGITTGTLYVTGASVLVSSVTCGSNLTINGPSLKIPVGDTSERPLVPKIGNIRYNSEYQQFEGFGPGNAWGSLGGVVDISQTTKIAASASPSVTDGNLYFYTVGDERMRVNSAGNIGIATSAPQYTVDINGTLGVTTSISTENLYVHNINTGTINATSLSAYVVANSITSGNIIPDTGLTYDLGSSTNPWKDLYLSNSTIKFANNTSVSSSNGHLIITDNNTNKSVVLGSSISAGSLVVTASSILNGPVTAGSLAITGSSILNGDVTFGSTITVNGPSLKIPVGNVASRPSIPRTGDIRYNNEYQQFEGYGPGNAWGSLGGVVDISQTTKILASASPSVTDGNLYFYTVGTERMRVNSSGNIGIATSSPQYTVHVNGTLGAESGITSANLNVDGTSILRGAVTAGSIDITGESKLESNVTMGSNAVVVGPAFKIPVGNVASRPLNPQQGYIRYNSEYVQFEGYGPGNAWGSLGGVVDIAQSTKILASATPSVTDGNLYFYTVGSERMRINSSGNIGIGTSAPSFNLDLVGTFGASTSVSTGNIYVGNTIVANTIDMTPSLGDIIKEVSFSAQNNQLVEQSITGFAFPNNTVRSFAAIVSVAILKSSGQNLYANFDIRGVQKDIGDWSINTNFIGDVTGIEFSITNINNKGQIRYISEDLSSWLSTTIKFKATTTSL